jgi:hypothetical protein
LAADFLVATSSTPADPFAVASEARMVTLLTGSIAAAVVLVTALHPERQPAFDLALAVADRHKTIGRGVSKHRGLRSLGHQHRCPQV